jgi:transcriptional regulator
VNFQNKEGAVKPMYIPKYFKINDENVIFNLLEENSFATLISQHNGESYASHLPFVLNKEERALYGHFARPNGQWKDIQNQQVLVIFQGPHCYISPSWYETKMAVPTWNYVAAHIYGEMEIVENDEEVFDALRKMVEKYEIPNSSYQLDEVDSNYVEGLSKGIVGFKIKITRMEGKAKLSQNHPVERQKLVIQQLEKSLLENNRIIADLMKANLKK